MSWGDLWEGVTEVYTSASNFVGHGLENATNGALGVGIGGTGASSVVPERSTVETTNTDRLLGNLTAEQDLYAKAQGLEQPNMEDVSGMADGGLDARLYKMKQDRFNEWKRFIDGSLLPYENLLKSIGFVGYKEQKDYTSVDKQALQDFLTYTESDRYKALLNNSFFKGFLKDKPELAGLVAGEIDFIQQARTTEGVPAIGEPQVVRNDYIEHQQILADPVKDFNDTISKIGDGISKVVKGSAGLGTDAAKNILSDIWATINDITGGNAEYILIAFGGLILVVSANEIKTLVS